MSKMTDERLDEIRDKRSDLDDVGKELLREVMRLRKTVTVIKGSLTMLRKENQRLKGEM